ncbi:SpoIIE family protein phosphatase [Azonexus sp. IMCC34839]|uniref:SpoIIE family protein phosphatase n=1 Tax=Azonexus sp. IMCC34839 TaxID=3133695 RepID=UPI00399B1C6C
MTAEVVDKVRSALEAPEQHLSFAITLMEHLVVPTFVLDADHRVLIWNRACERLTHVPAAEIVGTSDHWKAFYEARRPCLADLVADGYYEQIADLYSVHDEPDQPTFGVHAENWCWMPRRGTRLYLAVDAGPVFDEQGKLIAVVETLRDVTEKHVAQTKVAEQAGILKAQYDEQQREAELARRILEHQIRTDLLDASGIKYSVIPASNFSGDLVLAARAPSGKLYALLADATGHGLAAAVSVLPMVQEFYRLVEHSQPLAVLIESVNFLLSNSLPTGRFVAATMVELDEENRQGEIWVGGMPDALLIDQSGELIRNFESKDLPLGISRAPDMGTRTERFAWDEACRLMLYSDGVLEALSPENAYFGMDRLLDAARTTTGGEDLVSRLSLAVSTHLSGLAAHDDMSVLVIGCSTKVVEV